MKSNHLSNHASSRQSSPAAGLVDFDTLLSLQDQALRIFKVLGSPLSTDEILSNWPSIQVKPRRQHLEQALGHLVRNGKAKRLHTGPGKLEYDVRGVGRKIAPSTPRLSLDELVVSALELSGRDMNAPDILKYIPSVQLQQGFKLAGLQLHVENMVDRGKLSRIPGSKPPRFDLPHRYLSAVQGLTFSAGRASR